MKNEKIKEITSSDRGESIDAREARHQVALPVRGGIYVPRRPDQATLFHCHELLGDDRLRFFRKHEVQERPHITRRNILRY